MRYPRSRSFDPKNPVYFIGLDLGQTQDYTAIAVVEMLGDPPEYKVRNLKRFPLGTLYPDIVEKVKDVMRQPNLNPNLLVLDFTGAGTPVADMFVKSDVYFVPVLVTGGSRLKTKGRIRMVPKLDLVSTIQVLLQTKRLKVAGSLPEAEILEEELLNFQVKVSSSGYEKYGAWREGIHDDLLFAVAIATWAAERGYLPPGLHRPNVRIKVTTFPSRGRRRLVRYF